MEFYLVWLAICFLIMCGVLSQASSAGALRRVQRYKETYELLQLGAETVVRAVEQTAWIERHGDGASKKERALLIFNAWTDENGVDVPWVIADRLIEEAVNIMTAEGADIHWEPPTENEYLVGPTFGLGEEDSS